MACTIATNGALRNRAAWPAVPLPRELQPGSRQGGPLSALRLDQPDDITGPETEAQSDGPRLRSLGDCFAASASLSDFGKDRYGRNPDVSARLGRIKNFIHRYSRSAIFVGIVLTYHYYRF